MKADKIIMIALLISALVIPCLAQVSMTGDVTGATTATTTAGTTGLLNTSAVMEGMESGNVSIVDVNYLGDEWVTIINQGSLAVNLAGWTLADSANELRYTFPAMILPAGNLLRIHPGHGIETAGDMYLGLSGDMLDDTGDVLILTAPSGAVVSRYTYPGVAFVPLTPVVPGLVQTPAGTAVVGVSPETGVLQTGVLDRGVLVEPREVSPPAQREQIRENATGTYVTELANVSAIFETNPAMAINITAASLTGDERIDITNEGTTSMDLTGWRLTNKENTAYTLPPRVLLPAETLRVHSGMGASTVSEIYMNMTQPFLNDTSDLITLMDASGAVISRYAFPATAFSDLATTPGLVRNPGTGAILLPGPGGPTAGVVVDTGTAASPSGAAFLGAPTQALPGATTGQVQQYITGESGLEVIGDTTTGRLVV